MSCDPMAAAIDWLEAYRSSDLEAILQMYADDAAIECGCCAMATLSGKQALRTYWEQRFHDCAASVLKDTRPSSGGVAISCLARNGTVAAALKFNESGQIAFQRIGSPRNATAEERFP